MKRPTKYRPVLSAICIGLLASLAFAQAPAAPMISEGVTQKVDEGVYVIPDQRVSLVPNVGIVVGERGVLVVDTGMGPANAERVLREVRKLTSKEILYLTITHFHPEHGMGAQAFPPATRMVVPKAQRDEQEAKGSEYIKLFSGFSPQIAELLQPVKLAAPDIAFEHQLELDLGGGMLVRLYHFDRAHTRGDSFVYLPNQKILFCGDVVVNRFFPILPDPDASPRGWLKTLEELEKLAPARVVPGHGALGDASLIRNLKEYFSWLRGRVQEMDGKGRPLPEIITALTPEVQAKYKDWENPNWIRNAIERIHAELKQP